MTHIASNEKNAIANRGTVTPSYSNVAFLKAAEWDSVQKMLDKPSEPNEAMKQLFERGYQVVNQHAR